LVSRPVTPGGSFLGAEVDAKAAAPGPVFPEVTVWKLIAGPEAGLRALVKAALFTGEIDWVDLLIEAAPSLSTGLATHLMTAGAAKT
jgi:hypothetical protein